MEYIGIELNEQQLDDLEATEPAAWFTKFVFQNAESPTHPAWERSLRRNHEQKQHIVTDWIQEYSRGKSVLDAFLRERCVFFQGGASTVWGLDFDQG